jgi:hypothetical protein
MISAVRQFVIEPLRNKSSALFFLQLAQLVNDRMGGRYDEAIQRVLSLVKPKVKLPNSRFMHSSDIALCVSSLRVRGWNILDWKLAAADIAELRRFAFSTPAYADNPTERIVITESNIPHAHGRYMWFISDLIRVPAVQRLITDAGLAQIAQEYVGCEPILTSVTLWLDPVYAGTYAAHVYHYDNDGPSFVKFFIYLTDVDAESGAHAFIQGSHPHGKPAQFGRAGPRPREQLIDYYGVENELIFTGPAGLILAEDTAGFHKGTTLTKGYRLLLQLQYAVLDIPHEEEFVPGIERVRLQGVDPALKRIARKFLV